MIEDYFVEIFFWSVIPKKLLYNLEKLISKNNISKLIDPCCGNGNFSIPVLYKLLKKHTKKNILENILEFNDIL